MEGTARSARRGTEAVRVAPTAVAGAPGARRQEFSAESAAAEATAAATAMAAMAEAAKATEAEAMEVATKIR